MVAVERIVEFVEVEENRVVSKLALGEEDFGTEGLHSREVMQLSFRSWWAFDNDWWYSFYHLYLLLLLLNDLRNFDRRYWPCFDSGRF